MLTKFTVLTQLNSWSAAPWPQPGKLDVVVRKRKKQRRKSFSFEGEESERSHALNMPVVYISMSPSLTNIVNF